MRDKIILIVSLLVVISIGVCGFLFTTSLSSTQIDTLKILGIICLVSVAYCFIVGEISR